MLGLGKLGRLGIVGSNWSERALYPLGASSPGVWSDPTYPASGFQDSAGTTALSAIGAVADSSNPWGLILDRKGGATTLAGAGIHLSQSTSAARPLASGRVNLLTYSEDFSNGAWTKGTGTSVAKNATSPLGVANDAFSVTLSNTGAGLYQGAFSGVVPALSSIWLRAVSGTPQIYIDFGAFEPVLKTLSTTWTEYTATCSNLSGKSFVLRTDYPVSKPTTNIEVWHPQLNLGSTALPYQRVGAASDYDPGPLYAKFDGTDDGWLSATFTANTTFTAGMDAVIAIRRDSTANAVCGLYNSVGDATKFFGMAESGSGSGCVGAGAGTPTVWVDGTQLTGGTAVTRGTLHTALTAGSWHILEFRNLDLSTWTAIGFGLYTSHVLNGAAGRILTFGNGQDANREKAKRRMASYFGVTLA